MQAHRLAALTAIVLYGFAATAPTVKDLEDRRVQPLSDATTVLIFTRSDCPISNRYAPEIARIFKRTSGSGVRFWLVYIDPNQTVDAIRAHLRDYGYPFPALLDPQHQLVKFSGVHVTPEVAVYAGETLVYRGRIDNRHIDAGKTRPAASIHDLDDVLTRVIAREPVTFRSTKAVGCFIEDVR